MNKKTLYVLVAIFCGITAYSCKLKLEESSVKAQGGVEAGELCSVVRTDDYIYDHCVSKQKKKDDDIVSEENLKITVSQAAFHITVNSVLKLGYKILKCHPKIELQGETCYFVK